jgi:hypothetical protein
MLKKQTSTPLPITMLHAEPCSNEVVSAMSQQGFAPENDTLNAGSGDSDTN